MLTKVSWGKKIADTEQGPRGKKKAALIKPFIT